MNHHASFLLLVLALALHAVARSAETPTPAAFIGAPSAPPAAKASPLTPEEQRASFTLPPGFEIELVAAEEPGIGKFVTVDFDQRGRMWSMTAFDYPVDANEDPEAAKALYSQPGKDKVLVFDTPFAAGPQKPRIFADGLAIPLGILPYKNGAYVQHGPDIVFLSDTDDDGRADKREVLLSGFGVQDSHLFPHQFTRAPGGWIWMAQGAFNSGKVRDKDGREQQFDATRMAKFRPDGSAFEITSQGPCNIWGLVIDDVGQAWIQEANDYGFPVMPFHEYANYPGCSDRVFKSYAPEFPGTAPHFKMGGTGLSGLALSDKRGAWPAPYADVMFVANPITRQIQAIKITPDGPRFRYEKLPDFINSNDEWFRPIAIHFGPDGCLYIVDWYNKIISHNEVPRAHPDRDKTRGRIWRVKHKDQTPFSVPDCTKLSGDELIAKLGGDSLRQSHLAWQALIDGGISDWQDDNDAVLRDRNDKKLRAIIPDQRQSAARRIQALWALQGIGTQHASRSLFQSVERPEPQRPPRDRTHGPRQWLHHAGDGDGLRADDG
jgi:putative membrane-bound dehydrogenase-like protein